MGSRHNWPVRYALAVIAVALSALLRHVLTMWVGPGLPTFITFYPAVMAAALLAGLGPGLVATLLAALLTDYWLLSPWGFGVAGLMDTVGLGLFVTMGAVISWVAGRYRRLRACLAEVVAERTNQLHDANAAMQQLNAELALRIAAKTGELRRANEMLEQHVAERTGEVLEANKALQESRRAALNLMHDAIESRDRAELASAELRQERDFTGAILDNTGALVIVLDREGRITRFNRACESITGYTSTEALGRVFWEFLAPLEELPGLSEKWAALKAGDFPNQHENQWLTKGGDRCLIAWTDTALARPDGVVEHIIGTGVDITDLRRLQQQQKDAASRLARAQSAADTIRVMREGVVLMTMDGTVLSANPAMEQLTGLVAHDVVGRKLKTILPAMLAKEELDAATEAMTSVRAGHIPEPTPVFLFPPGCQPVCVLPSVRFMEAGAEGGGRTVVLTVNDITQLYEAEENLRVTDTLLRLFVTTSSRKEYLAAAVELLREWSGCRCVGIRVLDERGFLPYEACVGFSREFLELEDHLVPAVDACLCVRVATGKSEPSDCPAMTPGGSFCCGNTLEFAAGLNEAEQARYRGNCARHGYTSVSVVPIRYQDRQLGAIHLADERRDWVTPESVGFLETMAVMIGEAIHRFGVERELRESEYRHRLLIEHVPAITYTVAFEERLRITYVSPQIQSLLGSSADELRADPDQWAKQIHADDRSRVIAGLEAAIRHAQPFECEYRLLARDGREVWVHDSAVPVSGEADRSMFMQGVMHDITERRKAEEDRVRYEGRLRSLAAALSVTEEDNRWRISRQIHDTVVQSLSLSNIKLGALRKDTGTATPAEQQTKIDGVRALLDDAVHQARSLMTDLTPPLLYEMGLEPALNELADRLREEHKIAIELRAEELLPDAPHAVRGFLFASTRELIVNAVKHGHPRRIEVMLRAGVSELVLQVRDDGLGFVAMPTRGAHSTAAGGFGLFSIRERIEGLGGQFHIESTPGKGASITLNVPLQSTSQGQAKVGE